MADSYPIIPSTSYFSTTADNLVTPAWFNAVFANINSKAQSNGRYIRPVQIAASTTYIGWKGDGLTSITEAVPGTIIFKELGHEFLPNDNYTVSHQWSIQTGTGFSFDDMDGDGIPDSNISEVHISHSGTSISDTLQVLCEVTYTFDDGVNPAETIITSATFGLPCLHIVDGQPAISAPTPLIHIPVTHQPLLNPGESAHFYPENISLLPPDSSSVSIVWTLTHGGIDKSHYITNATSDRPIIKIPEVGKEFILTLTLIDGSANGSVTTSKLYTYDYGSFFFSSWGSETPVDAPRKVFLASSSVADTASGKLFPDSNSKVTVKWGRDIEQLQIQNGGVGTGYIYCVPGFSTGIVNAADVLSAMQEYGVGDENVENYSLVNMNSNDENLIGLKFWAPNMNSSAKIIYKLENPGSSLNTTTLDYQLEGNSVYLVKGVCPQGQQTNITVGPGAERYYIWLKHFENGTYAGAYDRYAVLTQSGSSSPIEAVFNKLPLGTTYKAEVVSANGSSYSIARASEDIITTLGVTPASIITVESAPTQYGLNLEIEHDTSAEAPVGYLVTYKEYGLTSSVPAKTSLTLPHTPGYSRLSSIYSTSSSVKIPATLNTKVMTSVRAVMSDGSLSDPVVSDPVTVTAPSDISLSGFSLGLGRHSSENTWTLGDTSLLDDVTAQKTLSYHSFGRDTFIETFVVNVHTHPTSAALTIVLEYDGITDANDQKVINIPAGETTSKLYSIADLSIPINAGTFISLAVQNTDGGQSDVIQTIDFTANIYYSHGEIISIGTSFTQQSEQAA